MQADILFPINANAFTYLVPEEMESGIRAGSRVLAPFKNKDKVGIIVALHSGKLTDKKIVLKSLKALLDEEPLVPESLLRLINWAGQYYISTSGLALKNAVPSGLFKGSRSGTPRIAYDAEIKKIPPFELTAEQSAALTEINNAGAGVFLVHGVTGSGKTEIYIRAIKALPEDREALVLVPEIAITAQMIDRFRSNFKDRVVFFHSGISSGEKIAGWRKMRNGEAKVVLGVRSAVFAPLTKLGLIVIDEEQEASYKQSEGFRYNARDVALARAKLENLKVILGSATPSIESFYSARTGKFRYLELKRRIAGKPMPGVEIIDMTKEEKKSWALSNRLIKALQENISDKLQSLIMLNRRGYSPFPICTDCGYSYKCPACSITLTYHKDTGTLNCHYCGSYLKPKDLCPKCSGSRIKYMGLGTQRVEEDIRSILPSLSLTRMDRDTTRKKLSHYRIIKQMEDKKIDVLLGTQMVAKGHDFPDVTLSAVVSADIALNLPDFRSAERAFQLFTQLAGRAGRGDISGKALIQTYEPDHYVFSFVKEHNYKGFYEKEIELRKELSYPPFSRLVRIILSFRTKDAAKNITGDISKKVRKMKIPGIEILGPSPAPVEKIRNLWRWHLILKGKGSNILRRAALDIVKEIEDIKDIKIEIDVDPINLL